MITEITQKVIFINLPRETAIPGMACKGKNQNISFVSEVGPTVDTV